MANVTGIGTIKTDTFIRDTTLPIHTCMTLVIVLNSGGSSRLRKCTKCLWKTNTILLKKYSALLLNYSRVVEVQNRDRPRFFDQVGHQTTNVSIGNKFFFTE